MNTTANRRERWTAAELADLTMERGFRLRGTDVTRLDTFIDAAFAFVLTLLVISFEEIPSNYVEMIEAIKRIPAFAASFVILMLFWLPHRSWSRRYGLESVGTILLSLTLIFVVLVYVYPLRAILESMFFRLSGGYLPTSFNIGGYDELREIFAFYSAGFFALALIFFQLFRVTLRHSSNLALNDLELRRTRLSMYEWAIAASVSLLSIVLALTLPGTWVSAAGYIYSVMFLLMPIPAILDKRRQ